MHTSVAVSEADQTQESDLTSKGASGTQDEKSSAVAKCLQGSVMKKVAEQLTPPPLQHIPPDRICCLLILSNILFLIIYFYSYFLAFQDLSTAKFIR